jgi:benzylsuccinate CoA-transferase BbsF subunit
VPDASRPLDGIRVFELSTAIAAPICGRTLAHFGAEVVKVESRQHPDVMRLLGPNWVSKQELGAEAWADCGPLLNEFLGGKRSVGVDLKTTEGKEIARRLIRRSDVFLSNYSAPAVKALGFDFASLRAIRPDIVCASVSGFGIDEQAPYYNFLAWGPNQAPLIGLDELTGWADRSPAGFNAFSYPDFSNGLHAAFAVLTALEHRDRTGEGASIDLSQQEATAAILGPWLVQAQQENRPRADGNRAPGFAPHGIYATCARERYVAIAVSSDEEWAALCDVADRPKWRGDPRFQSAEARLAHQDELDSAITDWTTTETDDAIAERLQRAGVPAAAVLDNARVAIDAQLRDRGFWMLPEHARFGRDLVTGCPLKLSRSPGSLDRAGPSFGQDNDYVLGEICGYSQSEIDSLIANQVVQSMSRPGEIRLQRRYWPLMRHFLPELPWPTPGERS